jgi:hypothetical protein
MLIRETAVDLLERPLSAADEQAAQASAQPVVTGRCLASAASAGPRYCCRLISPAPTAVLAAAQASVPPPVLEGNYERQTSTCLIEKETEQVVAEHRGFELGDEGRNK